MDISKNWGNIQCAVQKFAYSESMDGNNTKIWSPVYRHIQSSHSANWPVPPIQHDHAQPINGGLKKEFASKFFMFFTPWPNEIGSLLQYIQQMGSQSLNVAESTVHNEKMHIQTHRHINI